MLICTWLDSQQHFNGSTKLLKIQIKSYHLVSIAVNNNVIDHPCEFFSSLFQTLYCFIEYCWNWPRWWLHCIVSNSMPQSKARHIFGVYQCINWRVGNILITSGPVIPCGLISENYNQDSTSKFLEQLEFASSICLRTNF